MKYLSTKKHKVKRLFTDDDDALISKLRNAGVTYKQICLAFSPPAAPASIQYRVEVLSKQGRCIPIKRMI